MLWKLILCLSLLIVVTSEEVQEKNKFEDVANEILLKFSKTHGHKLKEFAKFCTNLCIFRGSLYNLANNINFAFDVYNKVIMYLNSVSKEFLFDTEYFNIKFCTPKAQEAIINEYIDDLLKELNVFIAMQGFDPIEMPDVKENFEWRVGFIKYKGSMHLTNGKMQGLASMVRPGDVKVTYKYPNVKFTLPMGYDVLKFNYKYKAKFMGLGPRGKVDGESANCKFTIDMEINLITLMAKLNKFRLNTIGKMSLKFSGSILTDWIANVFVSVTIPFIKPIMHLIVQSFVTGGVETVFEFYNNFVCNLLGNCSM